MRKIINDDIIQDEDGEYGDISIQLSDLALKQLPDFLSDIDLIGAFACYDNSLTSLVNSPKNVRGDFLCNKNQLTTLKGGPVFMSGNIYDCSENFLTSLEGFPSSVEDPGNRLNASFMCARNSLTDLQGCVKIIKGNFNCSSNELTSLKGSPVTVYGDFLIGGNKLKSLADGPKSVIDYNCNNNLITSLEGCPEDVSGNFYCHNNPLLKNLIGCPETLGGNLHCTLVDLTSLEGIPKVIGTNLDRYWQRFGDFYLDETLKDRFPEEYIRSLSDIKGRVMYKKVWTDNHGH